MLVIKDQKKHWNKTMLFTKKKKKKLAGGKWQGRTIILYLFFQFVFTFKFLFAYSMHYSHEENGTKYMGFFPPKMKIFNYNFFT